MSTKIDEYRQKQHMGDALLAGGALVLVVVAFALFATVVFGCATSGVNTPPSEDQFTGVVEQVVESDGVCLLMITSMPKSVKVRRLHLGMWQDYVANVPCGWPLPYEVTRWPMMVPNSCDEIGLCQWLDAREGRDCAELLRLGQRGKVGAQ